MRRRTLVDLIAADVARDPLDAPVVDVQDAVLAQDMGWLLLADEDVQPLVRMISPGSLEVAPGV